MAYELGTRTGDRCVAATVNGVLTPLTAVLTDGDVVDILVSRARNHPGPRREPVVSGTPLPEGEGSLAQFNPPGGDDCAAAACPPPALQGRPGAGAS